MIINLRMYYIIILITNIRDKLNHIIKYYELIF